MSPQEVQMAEITLEGGIKIRTFRPPRNFDPLTARAADVVAHGFPERPEDAHHLDRYRRVLGQLKDKFHYIEPTFRINTEKRHGPRQRLPAAGTETSSNWSGAVVFAPAGQSFKWIEGDWVVPNVDPPTQNQWYYCSNWIGIDGDGSGDVCQAGFECDVFRSGKRHGKRGHRRQHQHDSRRQDHLRRQSDYPDHRTVPLCRHGAHAMK